MMGSVVSSIQDLGVEVQHIPGGCTGLVQPVDVGIGKPFKNRIRNRFEDWLGQQNLQQACKPPSRQLMAQWIVEAADDLPEEIVKNAWRSSRFSYFTS